MYAKYAKYDSRKDISKTSKLIAMNMQLCKICKLRGRDVARGGGLPYHAVFERHQLKILMYSLKYAVYAFYANYRTGAG